MLKKLLIGCISVFLSLNYAAAAQKEKHTGKVLEVKAAGGYTYVKLDENGKNYWVAIMKADIKINTTITVEKQIWMKNFKSKALNQTFDQIMFADLTNRKGVAVHGIENVHGIHGQNAKKPNPEFNKGIVVSNEKAINTTLSKLYDNKTEFKNKNVAFQAEVIQASNKVMGNTWVKLTDGKNSVIFRSPNEDEQIKVGDKVSVVGTLNTDIDFGFGFKYEIIGVNAKFTQIQ